DARDAGDGEPPMSRVQRAHRVGTGPPVGAGARRRRSRAVVRRGVLLGMRRCARSGAGVSREGERADLDDLAAELAAVGREVRYAVLAVPATAADAGIVRRAGGDVVFGVDARADTVLIDALR